MVTIDLPFPISVNQIWRGGRKRVFKSKQYVDWINTATGHWWQQKINYKDWRLKGYYSLQIIINPPDNRRRDLGNLEKVCSDFAQAAGIIEDDSLCRRLVIEYGSKEDAPLGARLIFQPMTWYKR